MYNNEQKQSYIYACLENRTSSEQIKRISVLFKRIEDKEEMLSKDVSDMDVAEIKGLYDSDAFKSASAHISLCILKSYAAWCVRNGFSEPAGLSVFTPDDIEDIRNSMVSGDRHLNAYLSQTLSPIEEGTADNLIRALFWMVFAGIQPHDVECVAASDVNIPERIVTVRGKQHLLSPLAMPAMDFAVHADCISIDHPQYKFRKRAGGDCVLRGTSGVIRLKDVRSRLNRIKKDHELSEKPYQNLTLTSVYKSGLFSDMYTRERAGFPPDFANDAEYLMEFRSDTFGERYELYGNDYSDIYRKRLSTRLLEEYSEWKLAFVQ